MLESREVALPLPVVWSPAGPFNIELDELGMGFDSVALIPDFTEACRHASQMLRRSWPIRGDVRRIRLEGPDGEW